MSSSKTSQIIDLLHASAAGHVPTGFVLANDKDRRRAMTLAHQVRRLTNANSIVTCHNAQSLPLLRDDDGKHVFFDAVLADVPVSYSLLIIVSFCLCNLSVLCSIWFAFLAPVNAQKVLWWRNCAQKSRCAVQVVSVWRTWASQIASFHCFSRPFAPQTRRSNGLFNLQVIFVSLTILLWTKTLMFCNYQWYSLHPVENEAVVAELLRSFGDQIELLDVSDELPLLERRPGKKHLHNWLCVQF